ncbi:MAG: four helix bundle protein [Candidatus Levyibacteriota bacterium]
MNKFDSDAFYERMYKFAKDCNSLLRELPRNAYNTEYSSQLIRSSASVGANYIEAVDALSTKDFIHRLKISRKEARESIHWLRLIKDSNHFISQIDSLIDEANQIKKILTSSIITTEQSQFIKK